MIRAVMTLAVAGLVAIIMLWFSRAPPTTTGSVESRLAGGEDSFNPTVEVTAPTSVNPRHEGAARTLRTEPNIFASITRASLPDVEVPPWADAMEGAILSHIAQYPGLELAELQVQCASSGCVIFMGGEHVPVYQMGFDVFASQNGFNSAVIHSMDGGPNRIVNLRR